MGGRTKVVQTETPSPPANSVETADRVETIDKHRESRRQIIGALAVDARITPSFVRSGRGLHRRLTYGWRGSVLASPERDPRAQALSVEEGRRGSEGAFGKLIRLGRPSMRTILFIFFLYPLLIRI